MKNRNKTFTILSAIAMLLVILGHIDCGALSFWGLFPYYSFHVMIFVFISGYFYNADSEENILKYILHKFKKLMIPYFVWNLFYGLVATSLHWFGFEIGEGLSIYNLFIAPFMGGHQFMYNATAWFVPALFLLEVCNVIGRKVLRVIRVNSEWVIFTIYLMLGILVVALAKRGSVYDFYKLPGRIMLMAPCFGMGRIYREKLEKYDTVPTVILFAMLFLINLSMNKLHGGLAYSVVWVTGFAGTVITPFITAATGIWLWLRISRILAACLETDKILFRKVSNAIEYFGSNTYPVMMHQLMVFMGIKEIFYLISKLELGAFNDFDLSLFHTDIYYTYVPCGIEVYKLIYIVLGIAIPLAVKYLLEKVRAR